MGTNSCAMSAGRHVKQKGFSLARRIFGRGSCKQKRANRYNREIPVCVLRQNILPEGHWTGLNSANYILFVECSLILIDYRNVS